jgi:hypothetical protein
MGIKQVFDSRRRQMCVLCKSAPNDEKKAGKGFAENMKNPAFVSTFLSDSGVNHPPCFCCKQQIQKTCSRPVGTFNCEGYSPYSASPEKLERKLLVYISAVILQKRQRKQLAA